MTASDLAAAGLAAGFLAATLLVAGVFLDKLDLVTKLRSCCPHQKGEKIHIPRALLAGGTQEPLRFAPAFFTGFTAQTLKGPGSFRLPFRYFAQIARGAQKTGFGFMLGHGFGVLCGCVREGAETGQQFGHSLMNEMGQNRRFFKA